MARRVTICGTIKVIDAKLLDGRCGGKIRENPSPIPPSRSRVPAFPALLCLFRPRNLKICQVRKAREDFARPGWRYKLGTAFSWLGVPLLKDMRETICWPFLQLFMIMIMWFPKVVACPQMLEMETFVGKHQIIQGTKKQKWIKMSYNGPSMPLQKDDE